MTKPQKNNAGRLLSYTSYLAVDGYFMKKTFIAPVLGMGLQVITRLWQDANLQYIYKGPQHKGRGRRRPNGRKVNVKNIDKRRWKYCYQDDHIKVFELIAKSVTLNCIVKVVYLQNKASGGYTILSTDTDMEAGKIIRYYSLRFQIEFLIRDAKQHMELEECQAVSETKLYNHFNFSIMTVSLTKLACWASLPDKENTPFSMRSIKTWFYNKHLTENYFFKLRTGVEMQ
ncbi:transposase [Chitinophaga polysaccharea]|uniref:transposase n=1 Tax=Chitinophaga polysaccharea TaxID=1293035 RepID=UPI001158573F|nr:transposase [Chitinophaga polysaccharea]